jgi:hypothetical protein
MEELVDEAYVVFDWEAQEATLTEKGSLFLEQP